MFIPGDEHSYKKMNSLSATDVLGEFVAFSIKNAENELHFLLFLGL